MVLDNDFQLGEWRVKPHTNMIEGPEGETHLEPKAMQVLALLAQRAGGVVQKQEILDDVWDGTYVSDEVLPNAIWELRKALGDDARKPRFIQTLPKKGYRLIVPVDLRVDAPLSEENASLRASFPWVLSAATVVVAMLFGLVVFFLNETATDGRPPRGTADDPYSVLIMSFDNHTNVEDLDWLSTGAPTMLRTGLAEISGIQVVSTARLEQVLADSRDDVGQQSVAHRTGADTVVRGSIFDELQRCLGGKGAQARLQRTHQPYLCTLANRFQPPLQSEHRAQRIAVRLHVRGQHDLFRGANALGDVLNRRIGNVLTHALASGGAVAD